MNTTQTKVFTLRNGPTTQWAVGFSQIDFIVSAHGVTVSARTLGNNPSQEYIDTDGTREAARKVWADFIRRGWEVQS